MCKIASASMARKTHPLPYKKARPTSSGPRAWRSTASVMGRPMTIIDRMAITTASISVPQQHAPLPLPHHLRPSRRPCHVPAGDVARVADILGMRPVILGHQREHFPPSEKVTRAVVRVRIAVIPLQHRHHDHHGVTIARVLAHLLDEARVLLPVAIRPAPQNR